MVLRHINPDLQAQTQVLKMLAKIDAEGSGKGRVPRRRTVQKTGIMFGINRNRDRFRDRAQDLDDLVLLDLMCLSVKIKKNFQDMMCVM